MSDAGARAAAVLIHVHVARRALGYFEAERDILDPNTGELLDRAAAERALVTALDACSRAHAQLRKLP